ncbi:MAG: hypothetical protein BK997_02970 [Candidatus Micrarchaeum sp. ARMAN-1]|nr:MAG: hypothetical protein BK997_02970 [Candidatus Micrarchaeum sp. ARMAN-1]
MLVTRPDNDEATHYLSEYAKLSLSAAREKSFLIIDLEKEKATRRNLESYIAKQNPSLIFFNGHGGPDVVTGHLMEPLVKLGENESILRSKIVYSIACSSSKKLGPESISSGAICYVGYDDDFIFLVDKNKETAPINDGLASMFLEHSLIFVRTLVKGNPVSDAYEKAKNKLYENFISALASKESDVAQYLYWDYKIFAKDGDDSARIEG